MQRYEILVREVDADGESVELMMTTGPASACLALLPHVTAFLREQDTTPTWHMKADGDFVRSDEVAARAIPVGGEPVRIADSATPAAPSAERPKRTRRSKAEMEAARAAEAAGGAPAGDDELVDGPDAEPAPAAVSTGGVVNPTVPPAFGGVIAHVPGQTAPAAPYNPFA